jgi:hypothetical protein
MRARDMTAPGRHGLCREHERHIAGKKALLLAELLSGLRPALSRRLVDRVSVWPRIIRAPFLAERITRLRIQAQRFR